MIEKIIFIFLAIEPLPIPQFPPFYEGIFIENFYPFLKESFDEA